MYNTINYFSLSISAFEHRKVNIEQDEKTRRGNKTRKLIHTMVKDVQNEIEQN